MGFKNRREMKMHLFDMLRTCSDKEVLNHGMLASTATAFTVAIAPPHLLLLLLLRLSAAILSGTIACMPNPEALGVPTI